MPTEIDSLQIKIQAEAVKANDAIDRLDDKLERLEIALERIRKVNLNSFTNSISALSKSVTSLKTTGFTRLAENINKLSNLDTSKLSHIPNALNQMVGSLNKVAMLSDNAQNIGLLAANISKLGNKTATNAIANLPQLTKELENLISSLSKAPRVNQSVIDMTNAIANLASQGSKVGRASKTMVSGLNKTTTAMARTRSQATSLASAFGKFYASYFMIIRGVKGLWGAIEDSMDYVETYNYFNVALGEIGKDTAARFGEFGKESAEAYAKEFGDKLNELNKKMTGYIVDDEGALQLAGDMGLGLNIQQMMNFQAKVLSVTNSVGLLGEASTSTAKALTMLAGDYSSLTNLPVEQVMEKLTSGMIGQSRALYSMGIDITNSTLQQYAYAEGIEKAVSEMTQSEKMQLRLLAILDQSEVAWGDLGNTVDSVANQYRIFQQQVGNLGRTFGNLFLPIVKNVLPYVNGLVIALNNLFTSLGFSIYGDTWLNDLQDGISGGIQGDIEDLEGGMEEADDAAKQLKKSLSSFDELDVISLGGVSSAKDAEGVIDLTESIADALKKYEIEWDEAFNGAENRANEFAENISKAFNFEKVAEDLGNLIETLDDFKDSIGPFAEGFGVGFLSFAETLSKTSLDIFTSSLSAFSKILKEVDPEVLEDVGETLGTVAGAVVTLSAVNNISKIFTSLSGGFELLGSTLTKHPILSAFALAPGILSLINLADKNAEYKISIDMSDIDGDLANIEESSESIQAALSDAGRLLIEIDQQPLAQAYQSWENLNSKVGELTEEEKGKLKIYADRIKELFPEAKEYIDENGLAYAGMADELERAIKDAVLFAQVQGIEDIVSQSTKVELQAELNLNAAKDSLADIVAYFANLFPELTEKEITDMLESYSKAYQATGHGNLFIGTKSPIVVAEERNSKRDKANIIERYNLMQELEEAAIRYSDASLNVAESEKQYLDAQKILQLALKRSTELHQKYSIATATTEEKTKALETAIGLLSTDTKNVTEKFGLFGGVIEVLKNGALKELTDELETLNGKEVVIPISLDFGSNNLLAGFNRFLNLPSNIPMHYTGGFPEDGLFMANHNELVGRFSNGKTAVANNQQIIEGIKQGVFEAVTAAMQGNNSNNSDIVINMDGREVFKVVRNRANEYYNVNGRPAFNI